jgi:hypothetical protein
MRTIVLAVLAAAAIALAAPPASAQIDYRNLDDERPVTTEDAYSIERYGFELLAPYHFEAERGGSDFHVVAPELEYGLLPNAQVGVKALLAASDGPTDTDWGLAGIRVFGLYNFNTESGGLPALALRADAAIPAGNLAGDAFGVTLKGIATRSWGRTRGHLNAGLRLGTDDGLGPVEAPPRWFLSAAMDRTFIRHSLLGVAEVLTRRPVEGSPMEVNLSIGMRWQWLPTLVLDAGATRRLGSHGPDVGLTIGLSHAFALRGLMPGGER